jgi:hypothetical protein
MSASPSLIPPVAFVANPVPAAYRLPGSSPSPPVILAQLLLAGPMQAGTTCFISDSTVPYSGGAIGNQVAGGGTNLCRVYSDGAGNWIIG